MTLRVGVIGHPIGHSLSPVIHQAAFDALGIDARYEAWDVPDAELGQFVQELRRDGTLGANVTVPHKVEVLKFVDDVAPLRQVKAANTIVRRLDRLVAYNTDIAGFQRALLHEFQLRATGLRVLVLGAGGSARAVIAALGNSCQVVVANRNAARAEALAAASGSHVLARPLHRAGPGIRNFDLIVNCTTVGMAGGPAPAEDPLIGLTLNPGTAVFDLVYNPAVTPLVGHARADGCHAATGLSMLVFQAAESFLLWTERQAPAEVMFDAARRALASLAGDRLSDS